MRAITLKVDGMFCEHCVNAVQGAIVSLDGVDEVKVDLAAKTVYVSYNEEKMELGKIKGQIEDQGFDVE